MAKILITGATGFVGSHVLETLSAINHPDLEIVAACRSHNKLPASYKGEVRLGDLQDENYLDRMLNGIDIICHAAGWPSFSGHNNSSKQHYLEPTLDLINRALEWRVKRFVNLSNIAVAGIAHRNDASTDGKPRRYAAMLNCMIAVENYLKAQAKESFSVVNLRLGIYCGKQLQMGVLPALLSRMHSKWLPEVTGRYGHLPLVDGRDIGQAFARAALAPELPFYACVNIVGPEVPSQTAVYDFMHREFNQARPLIKLPASLTRLYSHLSSLMVHNQQQLLPRGLATFLYNPLIDHQNATLLTGYNPEIHWQASLQDYWLAQHNNPQSKLLTKPLKRTDFDV